MGLAGLVQALFFLKLLPAIGVIPKMGNTKNGQCIRREVHTFIFVQEHQLHLAFSQGVFRPSSLLFDAISQQSEASGRYYSA